MTDRISWTATKAEYRLIAKIVDRAFRETDTFKNHRIRRHELNMDLVATHANGCPMDFAGLLEADRFNFLHDVVGICQHMDRATGKLGNCFVPRYVLRVTREAACQ